MMVELPVARPTFLSGTRHGHKEITFYVCQFLTDHVYFRECLNRMRNVVSPQCAFCAKEDNFYHALVRAAALLKIEGRLHPPWVSYLQTLCLR